MALRTMLKSKIHRAVVTNADVYYEGSFTIDAELMKQAEIIPGEQVHVVDVTNGSRIVTYAIPGAPGSGEICANGAAAHLIHPGDEVIILTYVQLDEQELKDYRPALVYVDRHNRVVKVKREISFEALKS